MLTIKLSIIKHSHRKSFVYNHNPMKYTSITDFQKSFVFSRNTVTLTPKTLEFP